ncbi:MAG: S9 family peptidase [Pirellulales bacterium]|nr:S9 family peptidase [Pirellulales bacterium]
MPVFKPIAILLVFSFSGAFAGAPATENGPPATKKVPVTDTFHGVPVTEHYRWLENWNDPAVRRWSEAQNAYARGLLDHLPHVEPIRARLTEIMTAQTSRYGSLAWRRGKLFAIQAQPPKQQPFLVMMPSPDEPQKARVLVDPNGLDSQGTTAIDWYVPSPDGTLIAVSLSEGGSELGDVHVYETATGRQVHEVIPRVNSGTAGGDLAWTADGKGFFYTRHPRGKERPPEDMGFYQQVYFHGLGTRTEDDRYEFGKDLPRIAEIELEMHHASGRLLATAQNGDGGEFSHALRSAHGHWRQLSHFGDKIVQATFGPQGDLFLISRRDAPRGKILRLSTTDPGPTHPETIVPQARDAVVTSFYHSPPSLLPTESRLYVTYQLGGPTEIRVFDHLGRPVKGPSQFPVSSVGGLTRLEEDDVLFTNTSFVDPPAVYRYRPGTGATERTALATSWPVDFSDVQVVREFATSKDGTRVPVNILLPDGVRRDGTNPTVVYGYGGYASSLSPRFSATLHVLLEQGFVYAIANLRGGAEYGEQWHRQGNLTNKQNVFDDFAAVIQHMIDRGYTRPEKLAIQGGSNGGLLMGATMTQHPELVGAVVSYVGIYDMLRVELSPNGSFNIPEFGTVKNPAHFRAMYAYSPYHNVKDAVHYPATLFLTGANDPRVDPMQSRKMTARLQAAASRQPILLRTSSDSGHGLDTALSERIEQTVDVYAFLFDRLGVEYRPVAGAVAGGAADASPTPRRSQAIESDTPY